MVNGDSAPPFTIYHLRFTKRLLLLVLVLLLGDGLLGGGSALGSGRLRLVLVEDGLDDRLVVLGGLDVRVPAERAQLLIALQLAALLRNQAADEVLLERVVALVD